MMSSDPRAKSTSLLLTGVAAKLAATKKQFLRRNIAAGSKIRSLTYAALTIIMVPLYSPAQENSIVGFVTNIHGTWFDKRAPANPLKLRSPVLSGMTILSKARNARNAHIEITLLDDESTKIKRTCDRAGRCGTPIVLPTLLPRRNEPASAMEEKKPEQPTFWSKVKRAAIIVLGNNPIFTPIISRDVVSGIHLHDGVVKLVDGSVDPSAIFTGTRVDNYKLSLERIARQGTAIRAMQLTEFDYLWDPKKAYKLPVDDLKPGLYRISLHVSRTSPPKRIQAWVLVSAADHYQSDLASFQEAARLTKDWSYNLSPDPRSFLRAYLFGLAEEGQAK